MKPLQRCRYNYSTDKDFYEDRLRRISYSKEAVFKDKRVVLIIPSSPQVPTPGREFLVSGPFEGVTCIATLIKKMGYELKVLDCRLKENISDYVLEGVKHADIIGIATYCDSFTFLQEITGLIKESYPRKLIFLGGPLVTSAPDIILKNSAADCAILGEGELTLIEFFKNYFEKERTNLKDIKGMAYKEKEEIRINQPRPQIKNLDNLPLLDYTIWENYESIIKNGQILISSMRGCPQECSFCFKTIPALRLKSLERFEAEVAHLKQTTKFNYTWLNDLTFNVIEERAMKITNILKKYQVKYHCFARAQKVSKEFIEKLKDTGCLGIWFGIESYNQEILDANFKAITIKAINNAIKLAEVEGIAARGLFIVGLYGETEKSLKDMLEFIKAAKFLPLVKYLVPFPGTSLYAYAIETGKIKDVVSFLRMLSERKVCDYDDEIINVTDLNEDVLRTYFHRIWDITKEKEKLFGEEPLPL